MKNENPSSHKKKGMLASLIGIICNVALAAVKILVGALFGLVSVIADGFNNFSDSLSGVAALASFYVAEKPADKKHPFGHRRAEYVAAMATGFLVLFFAAELTISSIEKIIAGSSASFSWAALAVLCASIAVKAGMFAFYRFEAKKLNSDALNAAAADSLCDIAASAAVIIGLIILRFWGFAADGWAGIAVAVFIFWQGIKIFMDAGSKLLGQAPDEELYDTIRKSVLSHAEVMGVHDLRVFSYGSGATYATVHVEMDAKLSSLQSHFIIDSIENEIKCSLNVSLTAHFDPIDLDDEEARELESKVRTASKGVIDCEIHDFRIIRGVKTKVIFDLSVPFSNRESDREIERKISSTVNSLCAYTPIVTIERE